MTDDGSTLSTSALWEQLIGEVERLSSERPRGVNFSEDFAVDRVRAAISKLRQQHDRPESEDQRHAQGDATDSAKPHITSTEELVGYRVELAMEEQRLRIQQTKIDEARQQIKEHQASRATLERELQTEEAGRKEASDGQTKQWRDAALKTHLCLASVRAKDQEATQLRAALSQPEKLSDALDVLVKKLQGELDQANVDAAEAKRDLDKLNLELAEVEGRAPPEAPPAPRALRTSAQDNKAAREELLRIASRATESVKNLQAGVSSMGSTSVGGGVSSTSGDRGRLLGQTSGISGISASNGALGSKDATHLVRPARSGNNILGEAQRVLEKMETLSAQRDPPSSIYTASTLSPLIQSTVSVSQ